jgi:hypothetical protein
MSRIDEYAITGSEGDFSLMLNGGISYFGDECISGSPLTLNLANLSTNCYFGRSVLGGRTTSKLILGTLNSAPT